MASIAFSQRDPRWRDETLGSGPGVIGRVGCLLTASTALLATWGVDTDPHRLNQWLIANGGYANGNLMRFSALAHFGVHFVAYIKCATVPAPMPRLIEDVRGGAGVLLCMDAQPGNVLQPHWVHVTSLSDAEGQIMDPWQLPGREHINLATYLAPGWDAARGIFSVALYRRSRKEHLPQQRSLTELRSRRKSRAIVQASLYEHPGE